MDYRCEATSVAGFVQQLAVAYVGRGYFFYVTGEIPQRKDPCAVDARIVEKYGIAVGKATRSRRKAAGLANLQYLRFERRFVLLSTRGQHRFFEQERKFVLDVREAPIKFAGYSISYRGGHPHVRIEQRQYLELKAFFADVAIRRSKEWLEKHLRFLPFEPYAPIRTQLYAILREINRKRELAQHSTVPVASIRVRKKIVKPFGDTTGKEGSVEEAIEEQKLRKACSGREETTRQ